VTPGDATLVFPRGLTPSSTFAGLRENGWFAVSVAFADAPDGALKEVYELRYSYAIEHGQLTVRKQLWPAWNANFPAGPWHDGRAPRAQLHDVIE
jgi:hypothetical protein